MSKRSVVFFLFVFAAVHINAQVPQWTKGVVWYQIFPERFCNGDTANDPTADKVFINALNRKPDDWAITPWTSSWFEESAWEKNMGGDFGRGLEFRRYGGDLQGIINKLDYLKALGVGAIYLNPIFEAVSLHKYDGSTYHHIDVNFGPDPVGDKKLMESETPDKPETWKVTAADKLFFKLLNEAHKRNIKVVLDGVFNHTGIQFWAFQDIVKKGKASPYYDWYQIKQLDDPSTPKNEFDYKGWWGTKSLPEFNRTKENLQTGVKNYILAATKKWLDPNGDGNPSDGIDGWRLDVAREVPLGFWAEWHNLVKTVNPQAVVIGELWELSPDFIGEHGVFDALMNYNFAYQVNDFFAAKNKQITSETLVAKLKEIDATYPEDNLYALQNLVDSHDTERLISIIVNPDRQYEHDGDSRNTSYNPGKPSKEDYETMKLVVAFQMTYRGSPMIYYGDEAGMWGADDPHDRKPMVWDELDYKDEVVNAESGFRAGFGKYKVAVNKDLLSYYKKMTAIRNFSPALKYGTVEFLPLHENKYVFGFIRQYKDDKILVLFNLSHQTEIFDFHVDKKEVIDVNVGDKIQLSDNNLRISLWGRSVAIYKL
jgi:cyclomaltodextrinase / maltogenic alpha-amylase / neopullulanase